ncbi:MAG: hypothetical protein G01um101429_254 [Parcubacteria group bacterium Gr01-1014_29]|nr:MAG: hypothetical protein G01um101429_254 [Parcubacteria group bacterium Gr01-1014_29]
MAIIDGGMPADIRNIMYVISKRHPRLTDDNLKSYTGEVLRHLSIETGRLAELLENGAPLNINSFKQLLHKDLAPNAQSIVVAILLATLRFAVVTKLDSRDIVKGIGEWAGFKDPFFWSHSELK